MATSYFRKAVEATDAKDSYMWLTTKESNRSLEDEACKFYVKAAKDYSSVANMASKCEYSQDREKIYLEAALLEWLYHEKASWYSKRLSSAWGKKSNQDEQEHRMERALEDKLSVYLIEELEFVLEPQTEETLTKKLKSWFFGIKTNQNTKVRLSIGTEAKIHRLHRSFVNS